MVRRHILCRRCGGLQGHASEDGVPFGWSEVYEAPHTLPNCGPGCDHRAVVGWCDYHDCTDDDRVRLFLAVADLPRVARTMRVRLTPDDHRLACRAGRGSP